MWAYDQWVRTRMASRAARSEVHSLYRPTRESKSATSSESDSWPATAIEVAAPEQVASFANGSSTTQMPGSKVAVATAASASATSEMKAAAAAAASAALVAAAAGVEGNGSGGNGGNGGGMVVGNGGGNNDGGGEGGGNRSINRSMDL